MLRALLLYLLLAGAAVETYLAAVSVRYWVLTIFALYALLTAAAWGKWTWDRKASASVIALFITLAVTAWLPGGLDDGVRVASLATPTVFWLAAAAATCSAAWLLLLTHSLPRFVRLTVGAAACYGCIAFLLAAWRGERFATVLREGSFWRALPYVLQGTTLAAFIVLPLAVIVGVVRMGVRSRDRSMAPRRLHAVAASALSLVMVIAGVRTPVPATIVTATTARPFEPSAGADGQLVLLENSLRAVEDGERQGARDRWDPAYVVSQIGTQPERLFEWVRDYTFWIPYRGELRGAVGVLMDRQGNSLDRAVLLATLLEHAGHKVRLARRTLSAAVALQHVAIETARRRAAFTAADVSLPTAPNIDETAAAYQLEADAIRETIERQTSALRRIQSTVTRRVKDQTGRLLRAVVRPDVRAESQNRLHDAVGAMEDHWWVQLENGGTLRDYDLLASPQQTQGSPSAEASYVGIREILNEDRHRVIVRIISEQWVPGKLIESAVLEHALQPSELFGRPTVLQFWPGELPSQLHYDVSSQFGLKRVALEQTQWGIALIIGGESAARTAVRDTGEFGPPKSTPFSGLGTALGGLLRSNAASPERPGELTALWIEYEIRVPGVDAQKTRRVVFDLLDETRRAAGAPAQLPLSEDQRLARSLALTTRTEILPLGAQIDPRFVRHLAASSLLANREVLRRLAGPGFLSEAGSLEERLGPTSPAPTPLYSLALARHHWGRAGGDMFVDRPIVLTRHRQAVIKGDEGYIEDATDIVTHESGVDLMVRDGFAARLEQGVLDTNTEALLRMGAQITGNAGLAYERGEEWVTLGSREVGDVGRLELPADVRGAIRQQIASGYVIVAPRRASADPPEELAWWRIDPSTGDTLGMDRRGWGNASVQYAATIEGVFLQGARTFAFEYALCQGIPQAVNGLRMLGEEFDAMGLSPSWTKARPASSDPRELWQKNERMCLKWAIMAGFFATLPLLILTLRFSAEGRFLGVASELWRDTRGAGRLPPSVISGMPVAGEGSAASGPARSGAAEGAGRGAGEAAGRGAGQSAGRGAREAAGPPSQRAAPDLADTGADPSKTQLDRAPAGARPSKPIPDKPTPQDYKDAIDEYWAASDRNAVETQKYLTRGNVDPLTEEELWQRAQAAHDDAVDAANRVDAMARKRGWSPRSSTGPLPPRNPEDIKDLRVRLGAETQVIVGASGAANSVPWK